MSGEPAPTGTPRVMLANLARRAVAQTPDVALTAGESGRWVTVDRDRRIDGVTAVAQGDGRIEIGLHIVVSWPCEPLAQLAEDLRRRMRAVASRALLDAELGEVQVMIEAIDDPRDPREQTVVA